ncbi:MAG: indolepyruvate ferredoxin oxidoreductase family protein [Acidimicrobiales bacterium]|jgi:indolepyruvate ferredoxin oxidoreductase|uniref:indolepyruvate ferredoxin oxidoreductase family protein n=1 Tax=uncultured Ilumatobacter sp. TaxID=879968 RepID=UPI00374EF58B
MAKTEPTSDRMTVYALTDKFRSESGTVFVSGVQAVARIAVDQLRIDRKLGLTTAAFASGYQGSPVGTYTEELQRASATVPDLPIVIQPGVNEELAATAVMGSQLAMTLDDAKYDGVVGIWYGKGPGFDRSSDAIRHAVFAGTSQHGGVIAVVGDDPAAKSSTVPSSSDATAVDLHMPLLFPGDAQEALDLSRHAVALSRACGLWAAFKLVTAVADGTGTIDVDLDRVQPKSPVIEVDGHPFVPHPNGRLLTPYTLDMEIEFQQLRTPMARQYGVDNQLNRVSVRSGDDWLGIAACGHTFHEMREALSVLGFRSDDDLRAAGIRLFQLLMPVPLDPGQVREFADGLDELIVVEEKNPTLEGLIKSALYDGAHVTGKVGPRIVGRHDEHGNVLVNGFGTLDVDKLLAPLHERISARIGHRMPPLEEIIPPQRELIPLTVNRTPFYCSGCPHNASTRAEPGTLVGGGIGCHSMVAFMEPERVGDIVGLTQMGGEGAQWIGISPFIERDHLIQNIGDGTFFHSGSLAVRAAVAANVDITYKLLYNGTVAMTGGQDPQGQMSVPDVAHLLRIEGVKRIIVTSDDPSRHARADFPAGVDLWDRSRLIEAQQELAKVKGVTVLIHDQACAAEQRRGRSRGTVATPNFRVVINERVCEGCGDCGDVSNCLSVQPVDTPFGRKTRIHQGSCNFDFSCMKGDCPSFATVELVESANEPRSLPSPPTDIANPSAPIVNADAFTVRLTGIGGTGVITVSQIVGTAAMLADRTVRGLDQTGLSQKAGPVVSDLIITTDAAPASNHGNASGIDTILGFDFLVAAQPANLNGARVDRTVMVASTNAVPTGSMVTQPGLRLPSGNDLVERVGSVTRADDNRFLDAAALAEGLLGSTTTTNLLVLGAAVQCGALPLPVEAVERAIELNGVAVAKNLDAFRWGRAWIDNPQQVERAANLAVHVAPETTLQLFERLAGDLVDYQSKEYAARFRSVIATAQRAEQQLDQDDQFTRAVVIHLHKLMAYKDEYEVARLLLDDEATAGYKAIGGATTKVTYHLHPPMLRSLGLDRKLELRRSAPPVLAALRASKRVRGTLADPFRWAAVRQLERAMIPEYVEAIELLCQRLSTETLDEAVAIASLPDQVRGYETLKVTRATAYRAELADRMQTWATTR